MVESATKGPWTNGSMESRSSGGRKKDTGVPPHWTSNEDIDEDVKWHRARVRITVRQMAKSGPSSSSYPHWTSNEDIDEDVKRHRAAKHTWPMFIGLSYRCIGVIYGDLGTSPLYTYPTVFGSQPSELAIYGSISLIVYILLAEVAIKYVFITLYADDKDEGGTFAIYSLLSRKIGITPFGEVQKFGNSEEAEEEFDPALYLKLNGENPQPPQKPSRFRDFVRRYPHCKSKLGATTSRYLKKSLRNSPVAQHVLLLFVLWGISMFLGDGVMTCAVEVVSAISGLQIKVPSISTGVVVGVSSAILVVLFTFQFLGTSKIGLAFSPILILWFVANSCFGIYNIVTYQPAIFKCFNPAYAFRWLVQDGKDAWLSLGGIILCVTGCESMFSDLGHFSRQAVQFSTLTMVLPACLLTFIGEAAYLTVHPEGYTNPYYYSLPSWAFWPMLVLATLASIVSAQSLITATFSIISQSVALNCFPAVKVIRTSEHVSGQVYVPFINWTLLVGSIAVTCGFQTTVKLGNAFGLAFISVMLVTTTLVTMVQLLVWQWNPFVTATIMGPLYLLEIICFTSLCEKVPQGAWFPLALGVVIISITYLWHWGATQRFEYTNSKSSRVEDLIGRERDVPSSLVLKSDGLRLLRMPGLAIYYTENIRSVPGAFKRLLLKTPVLQRTIVFLTVRQVPLPTVKEDQRFLIAAIRFPGFYQVITRYGYRDTVDHGPEFIEQLQAKIEECSSALKLSMSGDRLKSQLSLERTLSEESSPQPEQGSVPVPTRPVWSPGPADNWDSVRSLADSESPLMEHPGEVTLAEQLGRVPQDGVVYILSRSVLHPKQGSSFIRKVVINCYKFLLANSMTKTSAWQIPPDDTVEVDLVHAA